MLRNGNWNTLIFKLRDDHSYSLYLASDQNSSEDTIIEAFVHENTLRYNNMLTMKL